MFFSEFEGYSNRFDSLSNDVRLKLCYLEFCERNGKLSLVVATEDPETFKKIYKKVPNDFFEGDFKMWGIDLESIGTDTIRIYRVPPKPNKVRIHGFYIDPNGDILQTKIYTKLDVGTYQIKRYDSNGALIGTEEGEKICSEQEWKGPKDLIEKVRAGGYEFTFSKKESKPQTYLIIHPRYFHLNQQSIET
jgi:hypothetical protein